MNRREKLILEKFVNGEILPADELKELKRLFTNNIHHDEISQWLGRNWNTAETDDIEISFDKLKCKIKEHVEGERVGYAFYHQIANFFRLYQRIAAILFIPLILGISIYIFSSPSEKENFYTAEAPRGQKAKVELPDGSTVWLNSGSSIRYSSEFNKKFRNIDLKGEAFFDVKKNSDIPFFVQTPFLDIKVTGTRFNVNAYNDEPFIQAALVEGHVNVVLKHEKKSYRLTQGNILSYSKSSHEILTSLLIEDVATGWKNNRLIFINDDFDKLARKIEKWYNMEVVYNPGDFKNNRLTVRLMDGEQLGRLLEIIEAAVGARCTVKENKIYITKL